MKNYFVACMLLLGAFSVQAQIETPRPSPLCTLSQRVGLSDFKITYSRPSAKGRKIFGDVVSYDKLWRTGANMATVFESSTEFVVNGTTIPAGEYALFAIPGKEKWTIILNNVARQSGTSNYKESDDRVRFDVSPKACDFTETFTINITDIQDDRANVELRWESTSVKFEIQVSFDEKVMKQIEEVMAGPGAGACYTAASYYYKNNKDLNQALVWVNKALENYERYWVLSLKAQIQAGLEDYSGAILTAGKAKEMAMKEGDDAYVKMNEERAAEWAPKVDTKKKKK